MKAVSFENNICFINIDNGRHNYIKKPEFINQEEIKTIAENNEIKAIIISGNEKNFSAGADLKELYKFAKQNTIKEEIDKGKELLEYLKLLNVPIVASAEGVCFGAGLEILINSDIKIAAKNSLFAFPEANIGLIPGMSGCVKLPGITGKAKSLEFILSGDMINADEALKMGIVDELVAKKSVKENSIKIVSSMIENRSLEIINSVVELVRNSDYLEYKEALKKETELFSKLAKKVSDNYEL